MPIEQRSDPHEATILANAHIIHLLHSIDGFQLLRNDFNKYFFFRHGWNRARSTSPNTVSVCRAHWGKLSETDYKSPQLTVWKKSTLLLRYTEKSIKAYGEKTLMAITIKHFFFSLHLHTFGTQMNTACALPMIIKTSIDISFLPLSLFLSSPLFVSQSARSLARSL